MRKEPGLFNSYSQWKSAGGKSTLVENSGYHGTGLTFYYDGMEGICRYNEARPKLSELDA
jgi:hypothetical protein